MNQKTLLLFLLTCPSLLIGINRSTEKHLSSPSVFAKATSDTSASSGLRSPAETTNTSYTAKIKQLKATIDKQLASIDPLARFLISGILLGGACWKIGKEAADEVASVFKHSSQAISAIAGSSIYLIPFIALGYILTQSGVELIATSSEPLPGPEEYDKKRLPPAKKVSQGR